MRNTINNPLIIVSSVKKPGFYYVANHSKAVDDQSGEYVDKMLAEEMLEALHDYYKVLDHVGTLPENKLKIFNLILKAKG